MSASDAAAIRRRHARAGGQGLSNPYLHLAGAAICWGIAAPLAVYARSDGRALTVLGLLLVQIASAAALLWVVVIARRRPRRVSHGRAALLGVILAAVCAVAAVVPAASGGAGAFAREAAAGYAVALGGLSFCGQWLRWPVGVGLAVGGAGLWLLHGAPTSVLPWTRLALMLTVAAAAGLYSVLAARLRTDPVAAAAWQALYALAAVLPAAAGQWLMRPLLGEVGPLHLAAAAVSGVVGIAVPVLLYNRSIRTVPLTEAGPILWLTPVAAAAGMLLLSHRLTAGQWLGAALVLGAVALVAGRGQRRETGLSALPESQAEDEARQWPPLPGQSRAGQVGRDLWRTPPPPAARRRPGLDLAHDPHTGDVLGQVLSLPAHPGPARPARTPAREVPGHRSREAAIADAPTVDNLTPYGHRSALPSPLPHRTATALQHLLQATQAFQSALETALDISTPPTAAAREQRERPAG